MTEGWTVLLDRDGVVNRRIVGDYVRRPDQFEFLPGAKRGIALLTAAGAARVLIVTNQAGVAKGMISWRDLGRIHELLVAEVQRSGGRIDAIFSCPHQPADGCDCRKPAPGLFRQARAVFPDLDPQRTVMVGDSAADVQFGKAVGVHTVQVASGGHPDAHAEWGLFPDLLAAARWLCGTAPAGEGAGHQVG